MTFNPLIEKKPSQKGKIYLTKSSYVVCGCYFFFIFQQLAMGEKIVALYSCHYLRQKWCKILYLNNLKKGLFYTVTIWETHL